MPKIKYNMSDIQNKYFNKLYKKHLEEEEKMANFSDYVKYKNNTACTYVSSKAEWTELKWEDSIEKTIKKEPKKKSTEKSKFKSHLLKVIYKEIKPANGNKIHVSIFTNRKSDIFNDEQTLSKHNIFLLPYASLLPSNCRYLTDFSRSIPLGSFNVSIITEILEFIHNPMDIANMMRQALNSLRQDIKYPKLIVTALTKETIRKKAVELEYMPFSTGYMNTKSKDGISFIKGYTEEDLKALLSFAGATNIWKPRCLSKLSIEYVSLFANMSE